MNPLKPYLIAGCFTLSAFFIPAFSELTFWYTLLFGPALLFGILAAFQARYWLLRWKLGTIVLICLVAYEVGGWLTGAGGTALQFSRVERLFLPPSIAAFLVLVGFGIVKNGLAGARVWIPKVLLGAAGGALSGLPLLFNPLSDIVNQFGRVWWDVHPDWGLHILIWYVVVGPLGALILRQGSAAVACTVAS